MDKPEPIDDLSNSRTGNRPTSPFEQDRARGSISATVLGRLAKRGAERRLAIFSMIGTAAVLVVLWTAMTARAAYNGSTLISSDSSPTSAIRAEDGSLRVYYRIQSSPTTTEESSLSEVVAIEFHPSFVILKTKEGAGMALGASSLRSLSWHREEPRQPQP